MQASRHPDVPNSVLQSPLRHDLANSTPVSLPDSQLHVPVQHIDNQHQPECQLLSGAVALSAQLVLLVVVVVALSIKRHRERPRRPIKTWLLDIGKQACSAGAGHSVGMLIAIIVHRRSGQASECGWYFIVYFMDCSLGLTLAITFHTAATRVARWLHSRQTVQLPTKFLEERTAPWWEALVEIGHYGDATAPNIRKWAIQLVCWVSCVILARSIVGLTILTFSPVFMSTTSYLDKRFMGHPYAYLYTVMVCIPLVVNVGQAWIQDQALKWKQKQLPSGKREDDWSRAIDAAVNAQGPVSQLFLPVTTQRKRDNGIVT